jgi:hypothetical protein
VERLRFPEVPVIVSVYVFAGVPAGGITVSGAVFIAPPYEAVIVTGVLAVTALVLTVKFALLAPAATITLVGTVASAGALLERSTALP